MTNRALLTVPDGLEPTTRLCHRWSDALQVGMVERLDHLRSREVRLQKLGVAADRCTSTLTDHQKDANGWSSTGDCRGAANMSQKDYHLAAE